MADIVNMQENEYAELTKNTIALHVEQLEYVNTTIQKIRTLLSSDDGFHGGKVSDKVEALMDAMETNILPIMEQVFEDTEQSLDSFGEILVNTDTVC